jgi:hypothetical protein
MKSKIWKISIRTIAIITAMSFTLVSMVMAAQDGSSGGSDQKKETHWVNLVIYKGSGSGQYYPGTGSAASSQSYSPVTGHAGYGSSSIPAYSQSYVPAYSSSSVPAYSPVFTGMGPAYGSSYVPSYSPIVTSMGPAYSSGYVSGYNPAVTSVITTYGSSYIPGYSSSVVYRPGIAGTGVPSGYGYGSATSGPGTGYTGAGYPGMIYGSGSGMATGYPLMSYGYGLSQVYGISTGYGMSGASIGTAQSYGMSGQGSIPPAGYPAGAAYIGYPAYPGGGYVQTGLW